MKGLPSTTQRRRICKPLRSPNHQGSSIMTCRSAADTNPKTARMEARTSRASSARSCHLPEPIKTHVTPGRFGRVAGKEEPAGSCFRSQPPSTFWILAVVEERLPCDVTPTPFSTGPRHGRRGDSLASGCIVPLPPCRCLTMLPLLKP